MPTADDPVPGTPRRILIAGVSGSGKTTLAGKVASRLGIEHTEIDALHHGPGWTVRPTFESDVEELMAGESWVTEWQYGAVRDRLARRAELLVWLDYPVHVTMSRVVSRTIRRRLSNEVLWNGNVEPPFRTFFTDRDHIVRWAWRTRHKYRTMHSTIPERYPELTIVRLRSPREADRWLAALAR